MGDGAVIKLASALWHMAFLNATHIQKHTAKSPSRVELYYNGKTGNAEILVHYGKHYFDSMKNNTNKTK
jgi:hypothetical protein